MTDLRVTTTGSEVWSVGSPVLRVTKTGVEVWGNSAFAPLRITNIGSEVWVDYINTGTTATAQTQVIMLG